MKWTSSKQQQLMQAIQYRKKDVKFGISCVYFALNTKVGAKMYASEKTRDQAYKKQAHAYQYKLAPQVGDCFSFDCFWIGHNPCSLPDLKHKVIYGYMTQNAEVYKNKRFCSLGEQLSKSAFNSQMWDLERNLKEIGIVNEDIHSENVGFIGKRMVCIDFDDVSCRWKAGRKRKDKDATRV